MPVVAAKGPINSSLLNTPCMCFLFIVDGCLAVKLDGDIGSVFRLFVAEGTDSLPELVGVVPVVPVIFKMFPPELGFMLLDLFVDVFVEFR